MTEPPKICADSDLYLLRPLDISRGAAVTTRTTQKLSWAAMYDVDDVTRLTVQPASTKILQTRQRDTGHAA